jgi:hypothetical protein
LIVPIKRKEKFGCEEFLAWDVPEHVHLFLIEVEIQGVLRELIHGEVDDFVHVL